MRKIAYVVILCLVLLAPVKRLDVANLQPVQTVAVYTEPGAVVLETDTHNLGRGATVADAVADLEKNTPGVIYLDTAEYLLISKDAQNYVSALRDYLGSSVRISNWKRGIEVDLAAKYLSEAKNLPMLKHWQDA